MPSQILASLDPDASFEWSARDRRLIVDSLRSEEAEDRRLAAELASRLEYGDVASELLRLLRSDPDEDVRATAAIAFGPLLEDFDTAFDADDVPVSATLVAEVRNTLRTIHDDAREPEVVRRKALEAAVRAPDEWMAVAARRALTSTDPLWRMTGVFAAGHLADLRSLVVGSLDDADPRVRIEAVRAAASGTVEGAIDRICEWARSRETERDLRLESIVALAHLPGERVGELLARLADDRDTEIAEMARMAIEEQDLWGGMLDEDDEDDE